MYLEPNHGYYTSTGEQHARQAWYLMLAELDTSAPGGPIRSQQEPCAKACGHPTTAPEQYSHSVLYAAVRKVALTQVGHFMMGTANVGGHRITLSGPVGNDGLPMTICPFVDGKPVVAYGDVPLDTFRHWERVPANLAALYWHDGIGHNDVNTEPLKPLLVWTNRLKIEQQARGMQVRDLRCSWHPLSSPASFPTWGSARTRADYMRDRF